MNDNEKALEQLLLSMKFLMEELLKNTTKIYDGIVVSQYDDKYWNVHYNGHTEKVEHYGDRTITAGKNVKIVIPQGNSNLSYFM